MLPITFITAPALTPGDARPGRARLRRLFEAPGDSRRIATLGSGGGVAERIARGDARLYNCALPDKKRPVVVLTRNSAIAYLSTVTVAPITSAVRGVPSEVLLNEEDGMKAPAQSAFTTRSLSPRTDWASAWLRGVIDVDESYRYGQFKIKSRKVNEQDFL